MRPDSGGISWEENEIRTQKIKDILMANKKYDYSDDVPQSAEPERATGITAEEARRQRLEQRNNALADEFRKLKPEIVDAHRQLENLIKGIGAYAGTIQNLHDLLKTSFPIRFAENDRQALMEEIRVIADNAISRIRREREKADNDIRRNDNRISMTQTTFWYMIALLLTFATFFAIVIFANMKLLHSGTLTRITVLHAGLIVLIHVVAIFAIYKDKQKYNKKLWQQ